MCRDSGRVEVLVLAGGSNHERFLILSGVVHDPNKIFGRDHEDGTDQTVRIREIIFKNEKDKMTAGYARFNAHPGIGINPGLFRNLKTDLKGRTTFVQARA